MSMRRRARQREEPPERTFTEEDYYPHQHGRYLTPSLKMVPHEEMSPILKANLCTECGVRIWERDIPIHDAWHDRIDTPESPT